MATLDPELAAGIEATIRLHGGTAFRLESAVPVSGGSIHSSWKVEGRGARYFVKTNTAEHAAVFAAECDGLSALAAAAAIRVPAPLGAGSSPAHAFLVLEYLDMRPLDRDHGKRAGEALAALHADPGEHYGWRCDNYIGSLPQSNPEMDAWPLFFARHRLAPQFERAAARGYNGVLLDHGARICEKLGAFFLEYRPNPALLHGDLWSGNIAMLADGEPVIFDPAVYRGDRETDLAMSELFGGLPNSFYAAYRQALPLDPGYETRKTLYNLYHVLNHLNLFGAAYLRQAERMAASLVDHLRH